MFSSARSARCPIGASVTGAEQFGRPDPESRVGAPGSDDAAARPGGGTPAGPAEDRAPTGSGRPPERRAFKSRSLFQPTPEGEARLLLLIHGFSGGGGALEGRTKLAKLDFLLRYPAYFARALATRRQTRATAAAISAAEAEGQTIEGRMVRYRYGPWDPAYYALLGRLIGKGLVEPTPVPRGVGYRTTDRGRALANTLGTEPAWSPVVSRIDLLKRHFDMTGQGLKEFIYEQFPEVTQAAWGRSL